MEAHRYWRLKYDASPRGYCSCAALLLRVASGGPDITQGAGGTPLAGSAYPGYGQGLAFDNDPSSFWSSGGGQDYIGYDFGAGNAPAIAEAVYYPRPDGYDNNDAPSAGGIEYSDDGATWTRIVGFADQSGYTANQGRTFAVQAAGAPAPAPAPAPPAIAANAVANTAAIVAVTQETPPPSGGAYAMQLAMIAVTRETPPPSGGAIVAGAAIVAVQIEFKQPYRNLSLPLISGPWGFPLFIAKGYYK